MANTVYKITGDFLPSKKNYFHIGVIKEMII